MNWPGWLPPAVDFPTPFADWAVHLGAAAAFWLAARGWGGWLARDEPFRTGLGWAFVGYAMLALGAAGAVGRRSVWAVILAGMAANLRRGRPNPPGDTQPQGPFGWRGWTGAALIGMAAALALVQGMSPIYGGYNLAVPMRIAAEGRLTTWPEEPHSFICGVTHMNAAAALLMLDDRLPSLINLMAGGVSVWAVIRLAGMWAPRGPAWLAGGLWATSPHVPLLSGSPLSDIALAAYLALAVLAFFQERLWVAGLCAGVAAAVRPQGLIIPAALAAAAALPWRGRESGWRLWMIAAAAAAALLPFAIRNFAQTGSPLYPFPPSLGRTPEIREAAREIVTVPRIHQPSWRRPWEPLAQTLTRVFHDPGELDMPLVTGTLAVALGAQIGRWRTTLPWQAWALFFSGFVPWLVLGAWPRYLVPWLTLLCAAAAPAFRAALLAGVAAGACGLHLLLAVGELPPGVAAVAFGRLARPAYAASLDPDYAAVQTANDHLPASAKVGAVGVKWYYLRQPALVSGRMGPSPVLQMIREEPSAGAAAARLRRMGVTHLLIDDGWVETYTRVSRMAALTDAERARLRTLMERHTIPTVRHGTTTLGRLK